MPRLEHWNVRTFDLAATIAFYEEVVGLRSGPFPGKPGAGAWLYDDADVPVVHVVRLDPMQRDREIARITARMGELAGTIDLDYAGSGVVDHVAFACDDFAAMHARLTQRAVPHRIVEFPHLGLTQILVNDPNGVTLELNFRVPEAAGTRPLVA
ncbi:MULTISPECIES: VOC family protein [unclassified Sphingobium]|uniref:VOC family protein n=1 Tax=unclassified Sphingobium TaxID=2611147 RepID=UPI0035A6C7E6